MATSRSSSGGWTGGAFVFSGRPDPTWPLARGEELAAHWDALGPWEGEPPEPPQLGYRGAFLVDDDTGREWTAYSGAVRLGNDVRRDEPREIERAILAAAPPGVLPTWVFDPRSEGGEDAGA
jgi:hypothetical protein